eukprot:CCRYP_001795-RB/>CCRYP_001795-RB protein AED:0.35 eAED:0.45 QI:0/0/0/1/0.5/0.2/5/0/350
MDTLATILAFIGWALSNSQTVASSKDICNANCTTDSSGNEFCKFTASVDLFASELGYFRFEECGDVPNPTLGIELGKTYQFLQADPSNHADLICPAPMYHLNDQYLGTYPNFDVENSGMDHYAHFGLDEYESMFQHPITEWIRYGQFSAYLNFDPDTDYTKDIFYFCHFMAGRIKLVKNGVPIQESDLPELGYEYESPTGHDSICVCKAGWTKLLHQMIPHHQNAVNMAKALLKTGRVRCDNLTDEESEQAPDCAMEVILREIISGQNAQIQVMRGILEAKSFPQTNDCTVTVSESSAVETRGVSSLHFASVSAAESAVTSAAAAMSVAPAVLFPLLTGVLVAFKSLAKV